MSTIGSWKAFIFMLESGFVGLVHNAGLKLGNR